MVAEIEAKIKEGKVKYPYAGGVFKVAFVFFCARQTVAVDPPWSVCVFCTSHSHAWFGFFGFMFHAYGS